VLRKSRDVTAFRSRSGARWPYRSFGHSDGLVTE
jgi:hypothetical protein